ncbi:MAG TPA: hypothetical protein VFN10_24145 [Thermoanaerobaculia bacterium]|nr:hypothetical protein [Thermoanaerobaculia bacterium]
MKSTLAIVAIALIATYFAVNSLLGATALLTGNDWAIPYVVVFVLSTAAITARRRLSSWLVGGGDDRSGAVTIAIVRACGLFLILNSINTFAQTLWIARQPDYATQLRALLAGDAVAFVIGLILVFRAPAIVRWLAGDFVADEDVKLQSMLFGVVALWVLIHDAPKLAVSARPVWEMWQSQRDQLLYEVPAREALASLIRIFIALAVIVGRVRLARMWARLRSTDVH